MMKTYLILGLLVTAACAEKKINLEDIERDNLKAENKANTESIRTDETKYAAKPNIYQQQYQIPSQYNDLDAYSEPYVQQLQNVKYGQVPPETYVQSSQYAIHETQHKQPNQILPQQSLSPLQYYGDQQQTEIPKNVAPIAFQSQKLNYEPEVAVGNHVQTVQQKTVTEKYAKPVNKEPVYVDIPMTQLLSYYPHLDVNSLKSIGLAQPPLATQQISVPIYVQYPVYNQKQLLPPAKTSYPSVAPSFSQIKVTTKGSTGTFPLTSKKLSSAAAVLPPPLSPAQEKTPLHTQAYIVPMQPQYIQQLVYAQPGIIYSDPTAAYSNLYHVPAYIQDNSLRGQSNQYQEQLVNQYQTHEQIYVTPMIAQEGSPKEILQEQVGQDLPQTYVKQAAIEEPKTYFVPPQLPPENFKSDVTQLEPSSPENEQPPALQDHSLSSRPKSLLDTYIPSKIIAAQDSARYKERPIKLEGGFLPSKTVNFALKKRGSE